MTTPVTDVLYKFGLVITAFGPEICFQVPIPGDGSFPDNVIVVVPEGKQASVPALAPTGPLLLFVVILTSSYAELHELVIVHLNV